MLSAFFSLLHYRALGRPSAEHYFIFAIFVTRAAHGDPAADGHSAACDWSVAGVLDVPRPVIRCLGRTLAVPSVVIGGGPEAMRVAEMNPV